MKKLLHIAATLLCLSMTALSVVFPAYAEENDGGGDGSWDPNTGKVWSEAVYMVNTDTGDVVYKKNEDKKMYPASTTKIMTAVIALEKVKDWNEKVSVPYACFDEFYSGDPNKSDVSNAAIEPLQDNLTYKDVIYALMLPSGCEAANILAYNIGGGDMNKFFDMMNAKAKELGCTGTHFSDAHGLFEEENYTTAKDLYLITKYAIESVPRFTEVCGTYEYEMPANDANPDGYTIYNTVSLINPGNPYYYYEGAYGVKTGTTDQSGRCLVSAVKRQFNYILVTLGAPIYDKDGNYYEYSYNMVDHVNFYDWAFNTFALMPVVSKDDRITETEVKFGENASQVVLCPQEGCTALLPKDLEPTDIHIDYKKYDTVTAPVHKGDVLGVIDVKYQGRTLTSINLVASSDVVLSQVEFYIDRIKSQLGQTWFKLSMAVLVILIICFIVTRSVENSKRRKAAEKEKKRFENYASVKKR